LTRGVARYVQSLVGIVALVAVLIPAIASAQCRD
jgi:hypothetical protein